MFPVKPEQLHVHFGKYRVGGRTHTNVQTHTGEVGTQQSDAVAGMEV